MRTHHPSFRTRDRDLQTKEKIKCVVQEDEETDRLYGEEAGMTGRSAARPPARPAWLAGWQAGWLVGCEDAIHPRGKDEGRRGASFIIVEVGTHTHTVDRRRHQRTGVCDG